LDSNLSKDAKSGLNFVLEYLREEFGYKFAENYFGDFSHIRHVVESQPRGFPMASEKRNLRKVVFRRRTTIYYQFTDHIKVIAIIDNRQDYKV
jgi:plasmid stabilization system protein ParE